MDDLRDAIASMIRRATLDEIDDAGSQQTMKLRGLKSESLKGVVRVQPFGFTSNPPAGSEGILMSLGGRADRSMILGVEHPDHRPKGRGGGSTAIYDAYGNIVSLVQADLTVRHASKIRLEVGGVAIEITSTGVTITGGTVRHNVKNIGDTHIHGGIVVGGANTAVPAN